MQKRKYFSFGKNWKQFLGSLDNERVLEAEKSLQTMLNLKSLKGKTFLDIGSGSGLFSLAARNLGAKVVSFDYDIESVECTKILKEKFYPKDKNWKIHQGSILDRNFIRKLPSFDIVYSWGVLHHTGEMWNAIKISSDLVKKRGLFFISIYNDQGFKSRCWWIIKLFYNKLPTMLRKPYAYFFGFFVGFLMLLKYSIRLTPMTYIRPVINYKKNRGMNVFVDMVDWYGGFPYEFATYKSVENFMNSLSFELINGIQVKSIGCNEFIFSHKKNIHG